MNVEKEIEALAVSNLNAYDFAKKYLKEENAAGIAAVYKLEKSLEFKSIQTAKDQNFKARIENERQAIVNNGIVIRENKLFHSSSSQPVSKHAILAIVKAKEDVYNPLLASMKLMGFDYKNFIYTKMEEAKATFTPEDFYRLGISPVRSSGGSKQQYYSLDRDPSIVIKITKKPGRNHEWLFRKDEDKSMNDKFGNLFGLWEFLSNSGNEMSLPNKVKKCWADIGGIDLNTVILDEIRKNIGLQPLTNNYELLKAQREIAFTKEINTPKVPKILFPHIALNENESSRYLRYRGISNEVIHSGPFAGLLGTKLSSHPTRTDRPNEDIFYNPKEAIFEPTIFVYKDIDGNIINKELKNYFTKKALVKSRAKDPSTKKSFSRHTGVRAESLFISNIPPTPESIILIESPLDCLSHYQKHRKMEGYDWVNNSIYVANGGSMSEMQLPIIEKLIGDHNIKNVVVASDRDQAGRGYNLSYIGLLGSNENRFIITNNKFGDGSFIESISSESFESIKELNEILLGKKLKGSVSIVSENLKQYIRFFYTEENYHKIAKGISEVRKNNSVDFKMESPRGNKDWNDLLNAKPEEEVVLGSRPLVSWLKNRDTVNAISRIGLNHITIENKGKKLAVWSKNILLGNIQLDDLQFQVYDSAKVKYLSDEFKLVRDEVKKVIGFYSSNVDTELIESTQKQKITEKGDLIFLDGLQIANWNNGRIVLKKDIGISVNAEDRLEQLQIVGNSITQLLKEGLSIPGINSGSILKIMDNGIYFGEGLKNKVYSVGVGFKITPTPLMNEWDSKKYGFVSVIKELKETVIKIVPEKEVISLSPNGDISLNKNEFYWNGLLGIIGENNRFELNPKRVNDFIPESIYKEIEDFQALGAEGYKKRVNFEKRIRVDVDYNLIVDKQRAGKVISSKDGSTSIEVPANSNELADILVNAGIRSAIIKVGERFYDQVKKIEETNEVAKKEKKRLVSIENRNGLEEVYIGDLKIGIWDSDKREIKIDAGVGVPNVKIAQELKVLEIEYRAKRSEQNTNRLHDSIPLLINVSQGSKNEIINLSAAVTPTEAAILIAASVAGNEIISHEPLINKIESQEQVNSIQELWNTHASDKGKKTMDSTDKISEVFIHNVSAPSKSEYLDGTCIKRDIFKDPKWVNLLVDNENGLYLNGYASGELKPLYNISALNYCNEGFIRSNVPSKLPKHDHCIIAQDTQTLLAFYQLNREDLIFNERISLFSPSDNSYAKVTLLSAVLLKPEKITVIGDSDFMKNIESNERYLKGIYIEKINDNEVIKDFHEKQSRINKSSNQMLHDYLKDSNLPSMVIDDLSKHVYLPLSELSDDNTTFISVGTMKIVSNDTANNFSLITNPKSKGVYIPFKPEAKVDKMYVNEFPDSSFIKNVSQNVFSILGTKDSSEEINRIGAKFGISEKNIIYVKKSVLGNNSDKPQEHKSSVSAEKEIVDEHLTIAR